MIINTVGFLVYLSSLIFGVYNIARFRRHRSFPMGLFYVLTLLNLSFRSAYFAFAFFTSACWVDIALTVLPGSFSGAIGISQLMNYIVLSIRLDTYLQHRDSQTIL